MGPELVKAVNRAALSRTFYNILILLLTPLVLLRQLVKSRLEPAYRRRWAERLAICDYTIPRNCIWIHAVSVGETVATVPLVSGLRKRYPGEEILITTMTPGGSEQVRRSFGDSVHHVYLPYDLPGAMRRFVSRLQPRMCVIVETELWPNMIRQCAIQNIPCALVNARLSAKSAKGYAKIPDLIEPMLAKLSVVAAQSEEAGKRFLELGLEPDKLRIGGSIKFDCVLDDVLKQRAVKLKTSWQVNGPRRIWIAASTHKGEENIILEAHRRVLLLDSRALLILVPRHCRRFEAVYKLCKAEGFNVARRSTVDVVDRDCQVLLGDTMGELNLLYGASDVAFVGGSLVPRGGHNPIEPAAWGIPIVSGTNTFNFAEISAAFSGAGGQLSVQDTDQLVAQLTLLLQNVKRRQICGEANKAVIDGHRGAVEKQLGILERLMLDLTPGNRETADAA